jgi:2-polyprenyl-3-methyl-5-hydroxy-6-metoxy-1,4-benzoquinol methylase
MNIYVKKEKEFRILFSRIIRFVKRYKKSGRVLEIGAGVGLLLSEAKKAKFSIVGFEPSRAGVRIARKNFNIRLVQSDFTKEKITDPCDVVILNHVLEHLPDPHRIIGEARAVLAPGGLLVIGVPNIGSFLARAKRKKWQSLIPEQHRWHFTKKTLDSLVTIHGFKPVGRLTDNHERTMHPKWKRPLYGILDTWTRITKNGEAILVAYKKI